MRSVLRILYIRLGMKQPQTTCQATWFTVKVVKAGNSVHWIVATHKHARTYKDYISHSTHFVFSVCSAFIKPLIAASNRRRPLFSGSRTVTMHQLRPSRLKPPHLRLTEKDSLLAESVYVIQESSRFTNLTAPQ